jgi:hypothetical protein
MEKAKPGNRSSTAKGKRAPKNVDEYLAGVPEPARTTLNKLRAMIRSAVPPEATETISYRIPAFKDKVSAGVVRRVFQPLQSVPDRFGYRSVQERT